MNAPNPTDDAGERRVAAGYAFAAGAYLFWGLSVIFWKQMAFADAAELLAHRVLWAFLMLLALNYARNRWSGFALLRERRTRAPALAAGLLIAVNWMTYIYAVQAERLVEASIGYYINPLVSVFLAVALLRERLLRLSWLALAFAAAGVIYRTVDYGALPWISLVLAGSFALYGLIKKVYQLDSLNSLMLETLLLAPAGLVYLTLLGQGLLPEAFGAPRTPGGSFGQVGWIPHLLLIGTGFISIAPLYLFAEGARRIALASIGFLQYLAPSLMLALGVLVYGEPFTRVDAISFACIWSGLALHTIALLRGRSMARGDARRRAQDRAELEARAGEPE